MSYMKYSVLCSSENNMKNWQKSDYIRSFQTWTFFQLFLQINAATLAQVFVHVPIFFTLNPPPPPQPTVISNAMKNIFELELAGSCLLPWNSGQHFLHKNQLYVSIIPIYAYAVLFMHATKKVFAGYIR